MDYATMEELKVDFYKACSDRFRILRGKESPRWGGFYPWVNSFLLFTIGGPDLSYPDPASLPFLSFKFGYRWVSDECTCVPHCLTPAYSSTSGLYWSVERDYVDHDAEERTCTERGKYNPIQRLVDKYEGTQSGRPGARKVIYIHPSITNIICHLLFK
jgi:hypothetical protein